MLNILVRTALVAAVATFTTMGAKAADISGAGATFPYPIYAKWAEAYKKATGIGLNYQSIGSGGGIAQIKANTVTFGASDMPLEPKVLSKAGLVQFPTVVGGDVPTANLPGIKPGELVLDGPTLAKIYLGEIKSWDDPAIKKLNPNVKLPSMAIAIVHRSDGSGTTFIWTNYLSKVSPTWKTNVGASTSVDWPVGIGAKGNEGVANNVIQTKGAIGYNEYAYVLQNNMTYIKVINKDGKAVAPTAATFQAAAAHADWAHADSFYLILTNQPGPELLADRRRDLHPRPQEAAGSRCRHRGSEVLRLGLCHGRQDGRRARLRAAAGECQSRNQKNVGCGHLGHQHQRADELSMAFREGPLCDPSRLSDGVPVCAPENAASHWWRLEICCTSLGDDDLGRRSGGERPSGP